MVWIARVALVVVSASGVLATMSRVHVWQDNARLWADAVVKAPQKPRPWVNLGNQYLFREQFTLAADAYRHASRLARAPGRSREEQTVGYAIAEANLAMLTLATYDAEVRLATILAAPGQRVASIAERHRWLGAQR